MDVNTSIEAARAGEAGKALGVVADEMKNTVGNDEFALESINLASSETHDTLKNLSITGKKLQKMFQSQSESP